MWLYRALLRLYPASFRNEYGAEMCAVFAERRVHPVLAIFEVLTNAAAVHWDLLKQDTRYAFRTWRRAPGFALAAIVVVALGIGATTAVYSMADHVLFRPLPFPGSERLVKLWERMPGYSRMELSPANYRDWHRMTKVYESMGAYTGQAMNLVGQGEPRRLEGARMDWEVLPVLRVQPQIGRRFTADDQRESSAPTVILSFRLWQSVFGGDAGVLGRKVMLGSIPHVVIGVMPVDFRFPSREVDLWTPLRLAESDFTDRNDNYLYVVARLRPEATVAAARAELAVVTAQLARQFPAQNTNHEATVIQLRDEVSSQSRLLLGALFWAGVCVLLIACSNLANLLLARALGRRKELAVRTAMGAGRERLVRQLATENLLLAVLGGALGVGIAVLGVPLLATLVPTSLPISEAPQIDLRVLGFAALVTVLTGAAFGVLPALRACGRVDGLTDSARSGGGRKGRLRAALVIAEVAFSVVLLVSAGLLLRALWQVQTVDPGFRTDGVLTMRTPPSMPKYATEVSLQRFYSRVLSGVRELPGVTQAAYVTGLPMEMRGGIWPVSLHGEVVDRARNRNASLRFVSPGYYETLRIPLRQGRDVSESDTNERQPVAVVSESFVRTFLAGQEPLGAHFQFAFRERTIVGVVGDVLVRGLEGECEPQVYLPYRQMLDGQLFFYTPKDLVIRSSVEPAQLVAAARAVIHGADSELPITDVQTLEEVVSADTAPRAIQARVIVIFAAIAFLLAAIGIHGVLAFAVAQRTHEIGVRVALGAQRRAILGMVIGQGALLALAGLVPGAVGAYVAGQAMQAILAGVAPNDPETYAAAIGLACLMTVAGSLAPALRAVRIDPMQAMRAE